VVVDDDDANDGRQRVRLPFEDCSDYDADHYADRLIRAAETVLSPFDGWDRGRVERALRDTRDLTLSSF